MIKEAIILAGGLGTRLRTAVPDLPKCMAPVNGKPFIAYVIDVLQKEGIDTFIFSLGYMHEVITEFIYTHYPSLNFQFSIEKEPLGTGGAIKLAATKAKHHNAIVANGDTLFNTSIQHLAAFHTQHQSVCTLSLKPMHNFNRYGVVDINEDCTINAFNEKKYYETGLINGGLYALNAHRFLEEEFPEKFSFEKDYLEVMYNKRKMFGIVQDEYFIDIGIPEDYNKAQTEFARLF
jgi:D-glycero-alpha-D-manno-heptose 1-phosphate guanylyltransferase